MIGPVFIVKLGVLFGFLAWMAVAKRPFCRVVCPLGALYGLCNRLSFLKMGFDKKACVYDGACAPVCPVDHRMYRDDPNAPRCIRCLRCRSVCDPGAIHVAVGQSSDPPRVSR